MNIFRLIFWGLAYSSGISCLVVYFIFYLKDKNTFVRNLLFMLLPFFIIITSLFLMEFCQADYKYLSNFFGYITLLASCALIYTLPKFAHTAKSCPLERLANIVFAITALVLALAFVVSEIVKVDLAIRDSILIVLAVSILYSMCVLFFGKQTVLLPQGGARPIKIIALVCICLLPGFIFLDFFSYKIVFLKDISPGDPFSLPAFYLFLNVMLLITITASSIKLIIEDDINENFLKEFKISKREREIMRELIQGKTYREIGVTLFISLSTVRTHVYSLYQKTAVNNKVELIHLLKKYRKRQF
jgi:DNA-binding CsgD family transcriptional regulator